MKMKREAAKEMTAKGVQGNPVQPSYISEVCGIFRGFKLKRIAV
ncbi:MAG: hypothetical protein PUC26_07980 [Eubacteriales bacterium]|jgi:hypothetical protein|nr:hypothetical protein [Eubacteriales bacterium]